MTDTTSGIRTSGRAVSDGDTRVGYSDDGGLQEHTTETRRAFATTEFWVFLILSVAMLVFAYQDGGDDFTRNDAWRYATWLGIGYLVSRGLAKLGAYETFGRRR